MRCKYLSSRLLALLVLSYSCATLGQDLSREFEKIDPAVVVITTQAERETLTGRGIRTTQEGGLGAGVIIDPEGLVMTAAHVVDTADDIVVILRDGRERPAEVIASSGVSDIALIRILDPPDSLPSAPLGNSDQVKIGEQVFVIGSPYGLSQLYRTYRRVKPGDRVTVSIVRRGKALELNALAE